MADLHPETVAPATVPQSHEQTDVPIRPLSIFLAILATSLVVVCAIVAGFFQLLLQKSERIDPSTSPFVESRSIVVPGPQLQVSARDDMQAFRAREEQKINALEWIDQKKKLARIPIERAIELSARHGLPKWPQVPSSDPKEALLKDEAPSATDEEAQKKLGQKTPNNSEPAKTEGLKSKAKADEPKPSGESSP
jgi:hypothetical protein